MWTMKARRSAKHSAPDTSAKPSGTAHHDRVFAVEDGGGNMKFLILLYFFWFAFSCSALGCQLVNRGELSRESLDRFRTLLEVTPDRAAVQFSMALEYAQVGNTAKALSLLREALADLPWLDPSAEPTFKPLTDCPAFESIVSAIHRKYRPVAASHRIKVLLPKDLIPEGIASDPVDNTLYVGSIFHRKILRIDSHGRVSDFVTEGRDGLLGVLGIKVDARDRSVWAACALRGASALFHFDSEGRTLGHYVPSEPQRHEFNDLVVTPAGDILVTDDLDNAVYRLAHQERRLERIDLGNRDYPNGIALAADGKSVYVAHAYGIALLNPQSRQITKLDKPKDITLAQVDGLYLRRGALLAIQNAFGGNRIIELGLSPDGRRIVSGKLLEFRSANLTLPTTGTIVGNRFYYLVNTQIDHEKDGKLLRANSLEPVRIAVLPLK